MCRHPEHTLDHGAFVYPYDSLRLRKHSEIEHTYQLEKLGCVECAFIGPQISLHVSTFSQDLAQHQRLKLPCVHPAFTSHFFLLNYHAGRRTILPTWQAPVRPACLHYPLCFATLNPFQPKCVNVVISGVPGCPVRFLWLSYFCPLRQHRSGNTNWFSWKLLVFYVCLRLYSCSSKSSNVPTCQKLLCVQRGLISPCVSLRTTTINNGAPIGSHKELFCDECALICVTFACVSHLSISMHQ